jgi:hypothetical protein
MTPRPATVLLQLILVLGARPSSNISFNVELLQARGSLGQLGGPPAFCRTARRYIG